MEERERGTISMKVFVAAGVFQDVRGQGGNLVVKRSGVELSSNDGVYYRIRGFHLVTGSHPFLVL